MITIGADPEVFVTNADRIVSVIGKLGGTKEEPLPVAFGAVQEDNVLAEFNIFPCLTAKEFCSRINSVHSHLRDMLDKVGLSTVIKSSHEFDIDELLKDDRALQFGCNPDMNAYTRQENPSPRGESTPLRTAGGHVHIGYDNPNVHTSFEIVKACDVLLGIPSLLLDNDDQRRTLYGKPGACRIKAYGVEYRSLSNFWLRSDSTMKWVYRQSVIAARRYQHILESVADAGYTSEHIQDCINSGDRETASAIITALQLDLPKE